MTTSFPLARFIARTLLGIVSFQLAIGTQIAAAQTAPAVPAPADNHTGVTTSANGVPVINLATPNSTGVSHNRFNTYDVDKNGLILNNSATNAVSMIGGATSANPNLTAGHSASLILNEVVSPNAGSMLAGYQEIVGPRAELVIANPWGVTCNGCGFINTPRVTLTTGIPTLSGNGALAGFTITGGQIAIGANGLDATRQATLDLLARNVAISGNVVVGSQANGISGDLGVFGGASHFDYATRTARGIPNGVDVPAYAIDSSLLGGMYADRIHLVVTEHGAGVRLLGGVAALAGDLTITADGRILLGGTASAARDVTVNGSDVQVQLPDSNTYLYAGRDLSINAAGSLELDTGSIGALRNSSFGSGTVFSDLGGANDLRFSSGTLTANAGGALSLTGGYWTARQLRFEAPSIQLSDAAILYGTASTGTAVSLTTDGLLSIASGVYSNADAAVNAAQLEVGSKGVVAATGALATAVQRGSAGGMDNAGTLQGSSVNIVAQGDPAATLTIIRNDSTGQIVAAHALNVGESGASSTAGSSLRNDGIVSGDTVTIATTDTSNTNGIQAATALNLNSSTLKNVGKNAVIIGSQNTAASVTIGANTITNSGTIYSAGDLTLTPAALTQTRDPTSTTNPAVVAGRDLTLDYTGVAQLGTGDLQAGRDLTITGSSVNDPGATGAGGATSDVRYAGRNLTATAGFGGIIGISGGQWFSGSDLQLSGYGVSIRNGVQVAGAQSGSGTVRLNAPQGQVTIADSSRIFSGGDLSVNTPTGAFDLAAGNTVAATGNLAIAAQGSVQNAGTVLGSSVTINSANGSPINFTNTSSGTVKGAQSVSIGTPTAPAGVISVAAAAPNTNNGVFGGQLYINASQLKNDGTIRGSGAGSLITLDNLANNGSLVNFADPASGRSGLALHAQQIANGGLVYDAADLQITSPSITNEASGAFGSGEQLLITTDPPANTPSHFLDNQGSIWGNIVQIIAAGGLQNGRDPGLPNYAVVPGNIYAADTLQLIATNGSAITNNGTIQSSRNLSITGSGGAFRNLISAPGTAGTVLTGLATVTAGASGAAPGNLTISGFQTVLNQGGTIGATGDVLFTTTQPGATITNQAAPGPTRPGFIYANNTFTSLGATIVNHSNPIVSNAGQTGTVAQTNSPGAHPQNLTSGQPVSVTARNGTTLLTVGGANIPLPTTPNGQFVVAQGSNTGPLIQTNPVLGGGATTGSGGTTTGSGGNTGNNATLGSDYLAAQLGLKPDQQVRRLGDDNYESYLIQQQIQAETGRAVLADYGSADAMDKTLFDNAASEAKDLNLSYGTALTSAQIEALTTNIVWMVQANVDGQTVLVPVVYLAAENQAVVTGNNTITGYDVNIKSNGVKNAGGDIIAVNQLNIDAADVQNSNGGHLSGFDVNINANAVTNNQAHIAADDTVQIKTAGDIQNLSGTIAGWNVKLNAGGNIASSTLTSRKGDPISSTGATDVGLAVGSISASNDLSMRAGRDVTVNGSMLAAGHDAALIAGQNVNIRSFAKTTNIAAADGSSSNQMQSAQNAVVHVGGDLEVRSNQDVNVVGAQVGSSLGTTTLYADKGNVNVGVLELNHTVTSSSTSTGGYTQADVDHGQSSATFGAGVEHTTTTHTMTNTTGIGSAVSGNGVVVSTGKGGVNINGSAVSAGADGLKISSAGNINVTGYNNTIQDTKTTDRVRAGLQLDANADGVFFGLAQSENKHTTTATQTTAQTSTLDSGGDIKITGHGAVTNEGTDVNANGHLTISGKDVINKAAQNTFTVKNTSSGWETKEQEGLTTNGTGQSIADAAHGKGNQVSINNLEWQQRITGSSSNDSNTYNQSSAKVTSINAGDGITLNASNGASDEGTNYRAGENIVITAKNYKNNAAADTVTTTDQSTYGEGKATAGLNSSAEVALTVSVDGGHDKSGTGLSTARAGTMNAGGDIVIKATTGDATLEGTQINAGKNVKISAARDVNINQANNSAFATDASQAGSANASVSVSLLGTGGSVGLGASTTVQNSKDTTSTATTASIKAGGNITVDAGRDANSEGADFNADGNVGFTAKRDVKLKAATDQTDRTGAVSSGGAQVNIGFGADAARDVTNGGGNVNFEKGVTDYHETTQHGGSVTAGGTFSINAAGNSLLQGTQVNANDVKLQTGGNLEIESAQHTITDNSYDVGGHLDASISKGGGTGGASRIGQGGTSGTHGGKGGNAAGGDTQINVMNSQQDVVKNTNATIHTTQGTSLDVGGNASLLGANVNAGGGVSGKVAGNLTIQSRTDVDNVNQSNVRAYAGLGPVGGSGGGSGAQKAQEGLQTGANAVGQTGLYTDVNSQKKDNVTLGTASGISADTGRLNIQVGGNTTLTGASNTAADFRTAGTTTVNNVLTHTSESSTKFNLNGTVASAAGSNNGKGGDYGLNVYMPNSHGTEPPAPAQPKHPSVNGGGSPQAEPMSAPHAPVKAPEESAINMHTGAKAPEEPESSTHTGPKAPQAQPIVAHLPTSSPGEAGSLSAPKAPKAPDEGASSLISVPKEPIKLAQAPEGQRSLPVGAPHTSMQASELTMSEHQPSSAPEALVNAPHSSVKAPLEPTAVTRQPESVPDPSISAPHLPTAAPEPAAAAHIPTAPDEALTATHSPSAKSPETTTILAHQPTNEPHEQTAPLHVAEKGPERKADAELDARARLELETNPQALDIRTRATHLSQADRISVDENMYSILMYTDSPERTDLRSELLGKLQAGLDGPKSVRGPTGSVITEFPLRAQYVGENLPGFTNWHGGDPVIYFSAEEQAVHRLYVKEGQLHSPELDLNEKMPQGNYIFVVDRNGHMIAARFQAGVTHHSSLSGGQPVRMAGEFTIDSEGNITTMSNKSGHFFPDANTFVRFLAALEHEKVRLPDAHNIKLFGFTSAGTEFTPVAQGFDISQLGKVGPSKILEPMLAPDSTSITSLKAEVSKLRADREAQAQEQEQKQEGQPTMSYAVDDSNSSEEQVEHTHMGSDSTDQHSGSADVPEQTPPPTSSLAPTWLRTTKPIIGGGSPEPLLQMAA